MLKDDYKTKSEKDVARRTEIILFVTVLVANIYFICIWFVNFLQSLR